MKDINKESNRMRSKNIDLIKKEVMFKSIEYIIDELAINSNLNNDIYQEHQLCCLDVDNLRKDIHIYVRDNKFNEYQEKLDKLTEKQKDLWKQLEEINQKLVAYREALDDKLGWKFKGNAFDIIKATIQILRGGHNGMVYEKESN